MRGITPACAGKTFHTPSKKQLCRDHPRVCGENMFAGTKSAVQQGSPPRVRGKRTLKGVSVGYTGITPACAGKTSLARGGLTPLWDHPRACGENMTVSKGLRQGVGLPPRVRGKPVMRGCTHSAAGITPAYAGKTSKCHARSLKNRDHPRVCGENMLSMSEPILFAGSPPRMRGKPSLGTAYASGQGITPAHAGKTSVLSYVLEP